MLNTERDTMTNHTPGPWLTRFSGSWKTEVVEPSDKVGLIAALNERGTLDELKANARLIAAAPLLLEALERAEPWLGRLIADEGHLACAAPRDAEATLRMVTDAIALTTKGK